MPNRSFKTPKPGQQASARELERLAEAVRAHDRVNLSSGRTTRSTSGLGATQFMGLSGTAPGNNDYAPFWAQIDGHDGPTTTAVRSPGMDAVTTTLPVVSFAGYPDTSTEYYPVLVESEYMLVTAGQGTASWTVTRAIWGSTAAAHGAGASVIWTPMRYSFTEQQQTFEGLFADKLEPRQGTRTHGPAYEVNNNELVPTGSIVQMWLGDTSDYYLFEYCCEVEKNLTITNRLTIPTSRPSGLAEGMIWVEDCTFHWYCSGQVKAAASTFVTDGLFVNVQNLSDWFGYLVRWMVGQGAADDLPAEAVEMAFEPLVEFHEVPPPDNL